MLGMKIQYRIPVVGHLRLDECYPLSVDGREFNFELNADKVLTHFIVIVKAPKSALPCVQFNPSDGVVAAIDPGPLATPDEDVERLVRTVEGLLAIYGVDLIDISATETKWLAETQAEAASLQLLGLTFSKQLPKPTDFPVIDFAFAAQPVVAAASLVDYEVALNFNRKGKLNLGEERYIDAIYDFYFVFESMYANGQFKSFAVKQAFSKAAALQEAVGVVIEDKEFESFVKNSLAFKARFEKTYARKSPVEITNHFVDLRGFLHHHTGKRPDIWHPAKQREYRLDAQYMAQVSLVLLQSLTGPSIFSDDTVERVKKALR